MPWYVLAAIVTAAVAAVVFAARTAMRWAGKRGWVYNIHNPRPPGSGTSGQVEAIFQPSTQHVVDEQTSQRILATQDDTGAPPDESPTAGAFRTDDLVYVPVGTDRFRAHVIAEACRAAGVDVELLTADDSGTGPEMAAIQRHRLLVHRDDLPAVLTIVGNGGA